MSNVCRLFVFGSMVRSVYKARYCDKTSFTDGIQQRNGVLVARSTLQEELLPSLLFRMFLLKLPLGNSKKDHWVLESTMTLLFVVESELHACTSCLRMRHCIDSTIFDVADNFFYKNSSSANYDIQLDSIVRLEPIALRLVCSRVCRCLN